jgi:hypothetical protein
MLAKKKDFWDFTKLHTQHAVTLEQIHLTVCRTSYKGCFKLLFLYCHLVEFIAIMGAAEKDKKSYLVSSGSQHFLPLKRF